LERDQRKDLKGRPNCSEEGEAENTLSYRVGEVHDVQSCTSNDDASEALIVLVVKGRGGEERKKG